MEKGNFIFMQHGNLSHSSITLIDIHSNSLNISQLLHTSEDIIYLNVICCFKLFFFVCVHFLISLQIKNLFLIIHYPCAKFTSTYFKEGGAAFSCLFFRVAWWSLKYQLWDCPLPYFWAQKHLEMTGNPNSF